MIFLLLRQIATPREANVSAFCANFKMPREIFIGAPMSISNITNL